MSNPIQNTGWGFGPTPTYSSTFNVPVAQPYGHAQPQPHAFYGFPTVWDAVNALPSGLKRVVIEHHTKTGATLHTILGNLLGVVSFAAAGGRRIRGLNGKPMQLGLQVYVIAPPLSGKSASLGRFIDPVKRAMRGWPHEWRFEEAPPSGIKRAVRHGASYLMLAKANGDGHLSRVLSHTFELFNDLYDGDIPGAYGDGDKPDQHLKQPDGIVFAQVFNVHPGAAKKWLQKHAQDALDNGYLFRLLMLEAMESATSGLDIGEVDLLEFDRRITALIETGKTCLAGGSLDDLTVLEIEDAGKHLIRQFEQAWGQQASDPSLFPWVPRVELMQFFRRLPEQVLRIAGTMHAYENLEGLVSIDTIRCALTVGEFLAGEWLRQVYPQPSPPQPAQDELDAQELLRHLREHRFSTGQIVWPWGWLKTQMKNLGWESSRAQKALLRLCGSGCARWHEKEMVIDGKRQDVLYLTDTYSPSIDRQLQQMTGPAMPRLLR